MNRDRKTDNVLFLSHQEEPAFFESNQVGVDRVFQGKEKTRVARASRVISGCRVHAAHMVRKHNFPE